MNPRKQRTLVIIRMTSDLAMVVASWVLAFHLRFHTNWFEVTKGIPEQELYFKLLPFLAGIAFATFSFFGFYQRRHRSPFLEGLDIVRLCAIATCGFIVFTYFYEEYRYSRLVLAIFAVLQPWAIMGGRSVLRKALRFYRRNRPPRRTLIIGGSPVLDDALAAIPQMDLVGTEICGVLLLDSPTTNLHEHEASFALCQKYAITIFESPPTDWPGFLGHHNIESVIVAARADSYQLLAPHLAILSDQVTDIKVIPDLGRFSRLSTTVESIQGIPVIHMHDSPLAGFGGIFKRCFDLLVSALVITLLAPLLMLVALIIRLTSPGPVFYRQERLGVDGRPFYMLKFRSMPVNAESSSGPVFATKSDQRATPFGKFIRKFSIDELPQLLQVLKGEMSLVGPRPERPIFVHDFRRKVPGYMLRHRVKAGLTGWAQVNGWRGDTSIEKRIEFDLYYIQNWSFWLDLRIIFLTAFRIFNDRNAY